MTSKTFLLQALLVLLLGLYGQVHTETVEISLGGDGGKGLVGLSEQNITTDKIWKVTGKTGPVELICNQVTLEESADCSKGSLSIDEEKLCKSVPLKEKLIRVSKGNTMTVHFNAGTSKTAAVNCMVRLKGESGATTTAPPPDKTTNN